MQLEPHHSGLYLAAWMDKSPDGILISTSDGATIAVNAAFCRALGVTEPGEQIIGRNCVEIFKEVASQFTHPEEFIARTTHALHAATAEPGCEFQMNNGRIVKFDHAPVAMDAATSGHLWIFREMSEVDQFVKRTTDAVVQINEFGMILEFNPAAEEMFGYSRSEAVGQNMHDLITPQKYRLAQLTGMERFRQTGNGVILNQRMELTATRKDGEEISVELTAIPTRTTTGYVITGFLRDITERKRSRALLIKQGETARAVSWAATRLLEADDIASVMHDVLQVVGESFEADRISMFRHQPSDEHPQGTNTLPFYWVARGVEDRWAGRTFDDVPWDPNFARWYHEFKRGHAIWGSVDDLPSEEAHILRNSGIRSLVFVPIFVDASFWGTIGFDIYREGATWTDTDVTTIITLASTIGAALKREQLNHALRSSRETLSKQLQELAAKSQELEQATAMIVNREKMATLGVIAGSIAHEINSPLGAILNSAERLLDMNGYTDEQLTNLRLIERAAIRSKHVIGKLLATTRQTVEEKAACNVAGVVDDVLELYEGQINLNGIRVVRRNIAPVEVSIGHTELTQILTNLLGNAKDALLLEPVGREPVITISSDVMADGVILTVHDTGAEVSGEILSSAFEPFFTTKPIGQGTGIGLWICQRLLHAVGGTISIKSTSEGTSVKVLIPRVEVQ